MTDRLIEPTNERKRMSPMSKVATDAHGDKTWKLDHECELDRLMQAGHLDETLYAAGIWLRELWLKTHQSEGVAEYGHSSHTTGEMSDPEAWNFACWLDTQDAMGWRWKALYAVCIEDRRLGIPQIRDALDFLAEHRGLKG